MNMIKVILVLFSTSLAHADMCDFTEDPKVFSESKTKDYNDQNKLVSFYPQLKDFKTHFPNHVKITGLLKGDCNKYDVKLMVFFKKGKEQVHEHSKHGDHKHFETAENASEKAKFSKVSSYTKRQKINLEDKTFSFTQVPHRKFYEKLPRKMWLHQVKYEVAIVNKRGAVMKRRVLLLDSPMSD